MSRAGRHLLPVLIAAILISCQTQGVRTYTEEETSAAFALLSSDMIEYITITYPGNIPAERVEAALPASFSAYSGLVPLYSEIAADYSERIAGIISPLLPAAYGVVEDAMAVISASYPLDLIEGDTAFTEAVREQAGENVRSVYLSSLRGVESELSDAFSVPDSVFSSVRKAYYNLASVGGGMTVPYPVPFTPEDLSYLLSDILFDRLGEAERSLKNRPLSDVESPYSVFWEV